MNNSLLERIDALIEEYEDRLAADTIRLVNINSERSEPLPGAPFGKGPREVLDEVLRMGEAEGFYNTDYNVGVISTALKAGQPDLGIWAHGDVVLAGEGWLYEPYNAVREGDTIIGRGVTDNKGQLAAVFNLMRIFKQLGIELKYNPALYVGSCEEGGMLDLKGLDGNPDAPGFINVCTPPRLSLVPDGRFPVGYGARGMSYFSMKYKKPFDGFTLIAGQKNAPGLAEAVFDTEELPDELPECTVIKSGGKTVISASTPPRHGASPDPNGNMITKLTAALLRLDIISEEDRCALKLIHDITLDVKGKMFGFDVPTEVMPPAYVNSAVINTIDGCPTLVMRIGYPIELTFDMLLDGISNIATKFGFSVTGDDSHHPYINEKDCEVVRILTKIANEITETPDAEPFINGATYAHYLPNSYVYGMSGNKVPEGFPAGRGGAHGLDECVSLTRLKRAMRIYARALLALDSAEW